MTINSPHATNKPIEILRGIRKGVLNKIQISTNESSRTKGSVTSAAR